MTRGERAKRALEDLPQLYPQAHCELNFSNPLELLVATILSAQCTDLRVNMVTPKLFARYPDVVAYAQAEIQELEDIIRSTGFYHNKAKSIKAAAQQICALHGGHVPQSLEQLHHLPGVGRKTANVVLGNAFGIEEGVVVDTHVGRLSRRLGLTKYNDPGKVERDLMKLVPQPQWTLFSHWLIWHGRRRCYARNPDCENCELATWCPSAGKVTKKTPPKQKGPSIKKVGSSRTSQRSLR
ncbi:MAG: endonuclease III [Verrucomicrobiales bacterium]